MRPEHSRTLRLAASASAQAEESLHDHLAAQHVRVSATIEHSTDLGAAELLLANLARLPSEVSVDPGGLDPTSHDRLVHAARRPAGTGDQRQHPRAVTLRVHVGPGGRADLHGVPARHGARVAVHPLRGGVLASGLGAVSCAALLTGEIFKAITPLRPGRARELDQLSWCPVALSADPDDTPMLSAPLRLDTAIVGLGAVGTATARILGLLGATGRASLIDPERFAIENVGTYSLGDPADAARGPWKTELVAAALPGMHVERFDLPVEEFIALVDEGRAHFPELAFTGLDSVEARREAQMLWPKRLLDAATGDAMCGLHDVGSKERACLRCLFSVPTGGPSAAQRLADTTGLDASVLRYGDQPLRDEHLVGLDDPQRERLRSQLGRPICGLAQAIGLTDLPSEDYRPSVPFVSQQAACLAVGRLLAERLGLPAGPTFVQYDSLSGPHAGTFEDRPPEPSCYCQQRASLVQRMRDARSSTRRVMAPATESTGSSHGRASRPPL